jgi:hypothetical protein
MYINFKNTTLLNYCKFVIKIFNCNLMQIQCEYINRNINFNFGNNFVYTFHVNIKIFELFSIN